MSFNFVRTQKLFATQPEAAYSTQPLEYAVEKNTIPAFPKGRKSWRSDQLHQVGEHFGFMKAAKQPIVATVFVTKGGVLKSSLTLNIARMAALHNIKTCVLGLDMQGDITTNLGYDDVSSEASLKEAFQQLSAIRGLPEIFFDNTDVRDLILSTDLPTLDFIPETPELVTMEQSLISKPRREFWLQKNVIEELKKDYDLILIDASPNWSQLIINALVASDALIVPLECKVNNFRNFSMFRSFINEFCSDMDLNLNTVYIPTRLQAQRKLSRDIYDWYQENVPGCLPFAFRESGVSEEAIALKKSLPEHVPGHPAAIEINQIVQSLWKQIAHTNENLTAGDSISKVQHQEQTLGETHGN